MIAVPPKDILLDTLLSFPNVLWGTRVGVEVNTSEAWEGANFPSAVAFLTEHVPVDRRRLRRSDLRNMGSGGGLTPLNFLEFFEVKQTRRLNSRLRLVHNC